LNRAPCRLESNAILPILEAAVVVAVAPLVGVALATRRLRGTARAAGFFVALLVASAAWGLRVRGWSAEAVPTVLLSHATLAVSGVALAAFGTWLGSTFRDPLDAAAVSTSAALLAAVGLVAAGPIAVDLPTGLVNLALSASPIVSTASAANVDLLRTDLLYRISPLAHQRFEYPSWYSGLAWYGALLAISVARTARSSRTR
jgi:hypothetical protein